MRKFEAGGIIWTTGAAGSAETPAAFDPTRPVSPGTEATSAASERPKPPQNCASGPGNDNTRESMPKKYHNKLDAHLRDSAAHAEEAKNNFFAHTLAVNWTGEKGDYLIRAYNRAGENSEQGHKWPQAFTNCESQTVNAAMWLKDPTDGYVLVSVWTFSPTRDKNYQFYKPEHGGDSFAFYHARRSLIDNEGSLEHFSVGQDYWANDFHCPPLDVISEREMDVLQQIPVTEVKVKNGKRQKC